MRCLHLSSIILIRGLLESLSWQRPRPKGSIDGPTKCDKLHFAVDENINSYPKSIFMEVMIPAPLLRRQCPLLTMGIVLRGKRRKSWRVPGQVLEAGRVLRDVSMHARRTEAMVVSFSNPHTFKWVITRASETLASTSDAVASRLAANGWYTKRDLVIWAPENAE